MGGSKAGGLPTLPFPSPPPFHSPKFSDKPVGGKVRSSEGEVPRLPPYKYHPPGHDVSSPYYPWHSLTVHGVCENKLGLAAHTPIYKLKGLNQSPYIVHVICRCKTTIILPLRLQTLYSCILPIIYGVTNINCKRTEVI